MIVKHIDIYCCFLVIVSHVTNFKLSTDVEKNPGPTQNNTDSQETVINPVMQSDSSIMQLVSPMILVDSRLYEVGLQVIDVGGAGDCFFRLCITSIIWQ